MKDLEKLKDTASYQSFPINPEMMVYVENGEIYFNHTTDESAEGGSREIENTKITPENKEEYLRTINSLGSTAYSAEVEEAKRIISELK